MSDQVGIIAWGTKRGSQIFFSSQESLIQDSDVKSTLVDSFGISQNISDIFLDVYSLKFVSQKKVYTQYRTVDDWVGRSGFLAISLFVPFDTDLESGLKLTDVLADLMGIYKKKYMDGSRIAMYKESVEDFVNVVKGYHWQPVVRKNWQASPIKGKVGHITYKSPEHLELFFKKPFRRDYHPFREVVLTDKSTAHKYNLSHLQSLTIDPEDADLFDIELKPGDERGALQDCVVNVTWNGVSNDQRSMLIKNVSESDKLEIIVKKEGYRGRRIGADEVRQYLGKADSGVVPISLTLSPDRYSVVIRCIDAATGERIKGVTCRVEGGHVKSTKENGEAKFEDAFKLLKTYQVIVQHDNYKEEEDTLDKFGIKGGLLEFELERNPVKETGRIKTGKSRDGLPIGSKVEMGLCRTGDEETISESFGSGEEPKKKVSTKVLIFSIMGVIALGIGGYFGIQRWQRSQGEQEQIAKYKDCISDSKSIQELDNCRNILKNVLISQSSEDSAAMVTMVSDKRKALQIAKLNEMKSFINDFDRNNPFPEVVRDFDEYLADFPKKDANLLKGVTFNFLLHHDQARTYGFDSLRIVARGRIRLLREINRYDSAWTVYREKIQDKNVSNTIKKANGDLRAELCQSIYSNHGQLMLSATQNTEIDKFLKDNCEGLFK